MESFGQKQPLASDSPLPAFGSLNSSPPNDDDDDDDDDDEDDTFDLHIKCNFFIFACMFHMQCMDKHTLTKRTWYQMMLSRKFYIENASTNICTYAYTKNNISIRNSKI